MWTLNTTRARFGRDVSSVTPGSKVPYLSGNGNGNGNGNGSGSGTRPQPRSRARSAARFFPRRAWRYGRSCPEGGRRPGRDGVRALCGRGGYGLKRSTCGSWSLFWAANSALMCTLSYVNFLIAGLVRIWSSTWALPWKTYE